MKKVSYDKKTDALYFYFTSGKKKITETREISDGINADYPGNELIGIEVIDACKLLCPKLGFNKISPISYAHKISKA